MTTVTSATPPTTAADSSTGVGTTTTPTRHHGSPGPPSYPTAPAETPKYTPDVSASSAATALFTDQQPMRCSVGEIIFDCLPENTTVEEARQLSEQTDLALTDLLALLVWLQANDQIPSGEHNEIPYTESYAETVDNLLDVGLMGIWNSTEALPDFAWRLVYSTQKLLGDLARRAPLGFLHVQRLSNFEYEVSKDIDFDGYYFETSSNGQSEGNASKSSLAISEQTLNNLPRQDDDDISLTTLFVARGDLIQGSATQRNPASSLIVHSLHVGGQQVSIPVQLQIGLLREAEADEAPVCSFVDETESSWRWSTVGCTLNLFNPDPRVSVGCYCNHTTSFAVLMQIKEFKISAVDEKALEILTIVLCAFSVMGLMATLAVIMTLRAEGLLRSERVFIHIHLSFALCTAHLLLLVSGLASNHKVFCRIVATLMHYFFLAVFAWMLVEGTHLYLQIVRVFSTGLDKKKVYTVIGWGTPAVLVIVSVASTWDSYVDYSSCWLSIESNAIWAFVGPALTIVTVNTVVLLMVVRIIVQSVAAKRDKDYDHIKAGVKGALFLVPLLGMTWIFGVLSMGPATVVFQYLFVILNALQGVFIFLIYCFFNGEVRDAVQRSREKRALSRGEGLSGSSSNQSVALESANKKRARRNQVGVSSLPSSSVNDPVTPPAHRIKNKITTRTRTTTQAELTRSGGEPYHMPDQPHAARELTEME